MEILEQMVPYSKGKIFMVLENRCRVLEKDYLTHSEAKHVLTMCSKERHSRLFVIAAIFLITLGCAIIGMTLMLSLPERHLYQGTVSIFLGFYIIVDLIRNNRSLGIMRKLLEKEGDKDG